MVVEGNRRAPGCKLRSETLKLVSRETIEDKDLGGRRNNDRAGSVDGQYVRRRKDPIVRLSQIGAPSKQPRVGC